MTEKKQAPRKTLVRDARTALKDCAGVNSRLAARLISQFLDARMKPSGLSLAQFGLMAQIAAAEDDSLSALAERAGLEQSTLSRNLHGLEKAGLVEIAVAETDLRRRGVWLTEQGARMLEAAMPVWRQAHVALARHLDPGLARRLGQAAQALMRG